MTPTIGFRPSMLSDILNEYVRNTLKYHCTNFGCVGDDHTEKIVIHRPRGPQTCIVLRVYKDGTIGIDPSNFSSKHEASCDNEIFDYAPHITLHVADPEFFDKLKVILPPTSRIKAWWYKIWEVLRSDYGQSLPL